MKKLTDAQREALHDWWYWLQPESQNDPAMRGKLAALFGPFSRANRARLKRCETTELVLLEPALHVLLQRLETVSAAEQDTDPLAYALVAGLLAWIGDELTEKTSFASQLGEPKSPDRPTLSRLRFARLQTADGPNDFFRQARRALQIAGKTAHIALFAEEILAWYWEFQGQHPDKPKDRIQVRWATGYFRAALKKEASDTAN